MATDTMTAPDLDALAGLLEVAREKADAYLDSALECGAGEAAGSALDAVQSAALDALPALLATAREVERLTAYWCKDDETLAARIQRERDDLLALVGRLAREKQAHEATARRERRLREALMKCRPHVSVSHSVSLNNTIRATTRGSHAAAASYSEEAETARALLADIDAALAEEGQDVE